MRRTAIFVAVFGLVVTTAAPAWACAGLVAPNGSVKLLRTATLAAYHNGIEHYITSFEFKGGGAKFGSIVPLPGLPTKVTRAGRWTLQRLEREVAEPVAEDGAPVPRPAAKEVYEVTIDGLRITILEGGGRSVGRWAKRQGFALTPDAPEVLAFYGRRSRYFMAARFIPEKAEDKNLAVGDGVPIHLRIPTDNPWVPLRILALGKKPYADVNADVYLLTDIEPALLPQPRTPDKRRGVVLKRSEQASESLMNDLRSDRGMGWMPESMWLTYLRLTINSYRLVYDLAVDASGAGQPSYEAAYGKGAQPPSPSPSPTPEPSETPSDQGAALWPLAPVAAIAALRLRNRKVMPRS